MPRMPAPLRALRKIEGRFRLPRTARRRSVARGWGIDDHGSVSASGSAAVIWALVALIVAVLAFALFTLAASVILAEQLTRTRRRRVRGTPADIGLRAEEIQFLSTDGLILRGWFVLSSEARATVVIVHDSGEHRASERHGLLGLMRDYVAVGFNVFAFDLRGHGESAGTRTSFGVDEVGDVAAAVKCIRRYVGATPIVLHGFGTGATFALVAAQQGREVTGVIADSAVGSMRQHLGERLGKPRAWLLPSALWIAKRWQRADAGALAPHSSCAALGVPVLFIHGVRDPVVPLSHSINLAAASLDPRSEFWRVEAPREHAGAYRSDPAHYLRRCVAHIDAGLPATDVPEPIRASAAG